MRKRVALYGALFIGLIIIFIVKIQHLNSQYTVKNSQCPNIGTNGLMEFDQEELNKLYQNNDCLNKVIQIRFTNKDIHYFVKGVN